MARKANPDNVVHLIETRLHDARALMERALATELRNRRWLTPEHRARVEAAWKRYHHGD